MGGWKQKSGWIQIPPASCVPFTFPFLSQLSVCLIVSRVRAYLTTDQHTTYMHPCLMPFVIVILWLMAVYRTGHGCIIYMLATATQYTVVT